VIFAAATHLSANGRHFVMQRHMNARSKRKSDSVFLLPPSPVRKLIAASALTESLDFCALFAQNTDLKSTGFSQIDKLLSKKRIQIDLRTQMYKFISK
jgi:hypothetical protein